MTLEEAKKLLEKLQKDDENFSFHLELTGGNSTYFDSTSKKFRKEAEAINTVLKALEKYEMNDVYPLTIIKDRYSGTYSGGEYTAWNLDFDEIPKEINYDDVTCQHFWINNKIFVGKGKNPKEATENLIKLLGE